MYAPSSSLLAKNGFDVVFKGREEDEGGEAGGRFLDIKAVTVRVLA